MSDPIRSISQNNFILADQKEVAHDNTLRGNGTPESPLGVNETVLFETSGYGTISGTFSENYKNFERIKIWTINNDLQTGTLEIDTDKQGESFSVHTFYCNGSDTQWCKDSTFTLNNSGFSLRGAVSYQLKSNGITGATFSSNNPINSILKVIGINRIANN